MRVLVCGNRNWDNIDAIRRELVKFPKDTIIIHGNARGADKLSGIVANELGMKVEIYSADWNRYGRAAGPIRNKEMRDKGKPDLILAFHSNIDKSRGTKNMINLALEKHISVKVFKE